MSTGLNLQNESNFFNDQWFAIVSEDFSTEEKLALKKAIEWATPLFQNDVLGTGESAALHAAETLKVLALLQMDAATIIAALLSCLTINLDQETEKDRRLEVVELFGEEVLKLVEGTRALLRLGAVARNASESQGQDQQEMLRKMLLAMASDLRIVLIRLASRLRTLRWFAETKNPCPEELAKETRDLYASLANRLGIWQIKWEMEDLSFRFLEPEIYHQIAKQLEGKRRERETHVNKIADDIRHTLHDMHIKGEVSGRAKHIYSIFNKMKNKNLDISGLFDLLALRIIVENERDCYSVLAMVHARWAPVSDEFDDYISRPKPNGYRSLHTVLQDSQGHNFEVQIRTHKMHKFAEYGMAAHWRYKEAGAKGGQVAASSLYDRQLSWMRQLLAWKKDVGVKNVADEELLQNIKNAPALSEKPKAPVADSESMPQGVASSKIYVLTPQARVIELPADATPVDFAYHLHSDLGHRCRGAKVNGQMVALNTKLQTGQTVEIIATKSGGPSRDWLNIQLGYLVSPRARSKVRLWFNAIELQQRISAGQAVVEKELQRLGKTAINLEQLAEKLGFSRSDDLFVAVGKDEFSLRNIANVLAAPEVGNQEDESETSFLKPKTVTKNTGKSGVLVVGVDSLLTQLARCCQPAPPDSIEGFITRGRGVSIHRTDCLSFRAIELKYPERVIDVQWGDTADGMYPVTIYVHAQDRRGLLRDLSEVFARLKLNVTGVNTHSKASFANMQFTIEVKEGEQVKRALTALLEVDGVMSASRP